MEIARTEPAGTEPAGTEPAGTEPAGTEPAGTEPARAGLAGIDLAGIELVTVDDTRAFGRRLATLLRPGDLVILDGPLGAGKTALAQGVGAGLRVLGPVTSPTFVISRVHRPDTAAGGRVPLVHVDAYRLSSIAEVDDLDLEASLDDSVTVVEWGGGKVEQLAEAHLVVHLERRADDTRVVTLECSGGDWADRLGAAAIN